MFRYSLVELFGWTTFAAIGFALYASAVPVDRVGPVWTLVAAAVLSAWIGGTVVACKAFGNGGAFLFAAAYPFCLMAAPLAVAYVDRWKWPGMALYFELLGIAAVAVMAGLFAWSVVMIADHLIQALAVYARRATDRPSREVPGI